MTADAPSTAPLFPAGEFSAIGEYSDAVGKESIEQIRNAPAKLRSAVSDLHESQLETRYKNWTVRQIVHHVADSHLHSLIRFKWALTEDEPLIKAYEEGEWVQLKDSRAGDIGPPLAMLEGLHEKWVQLLESMDEADYRRTFRHPQSGESVELWTALQNYAWHAKHHTAQINWLREKHGW